MRTAGPAGRARVASWAASVEYYGFANWMRRAALVAAAMCSSAGATAGTLAFSVAAVATMLQTDQLVLLGRFGDPDRPQARHRSLRWLPPGGSTATMTACRPTPVIGMPGAVLLVRCA